MRCFDAIVAGAGGMGTAAAAQLARRGCRVLALDRHPPGHARGSSHGQSRLFRLAYFEHPDYVPLLKRARGAWRELERESGTSLFTACGLLTSGPPGSAVVAGTLRSAAEHGLGVEALTAAAARRRFPAFRIPDGWTAVFEAEAGALAVEACVRAHAAMATRHGGTIEAGHDIRDWRVEGDAVLVETARETISCGRLVLCPGAWAADMLKLPAIRFTVLRKSLFWYAPPPASDATARLPAFAFDTPRGFFYGFPPLDARGLKVAAHTGGREVGNPLEVDRAIDAQEQAAIEGWLTDHLPEVGRIRTAHEVCLYTMSADHHFVVGLHPDHPQVMLAAGFSGHGFKFASVIGEVLADLAITGTTPQPVGFLSPRREGLIGLGPRPESRFATCSDTGTG